VDAEDPEAAESESESGEEEEIFRVVTKGDRVLEFSAAMAVKLGLGRIVALHCRSSNSYRNR
jgi:hypothetical protein